MYEELQCNIFGRPRLGVWTDDGELRPIKLIDVILDLDQRFMQIEAGMVAGKDEEIDDLKKRLEAIEARLGSPVVAEQPRSDSEPVPAAG